MAGTINSLGDDAKLGALRVRATVTASYDGLRHRAGEGRKLSARMAQLTGFASASPFSLAACLRSGAAGRGSSSLR
ncbi:protein of unknown function (plasmid) [Cupriavidus taiwanensis]|uniref:Uncharacterized protein n=1 Tax=Cupriavidus taiwanensis TaxID=164546 RepID=A0A7Z7JFN8_9BURK|nr:protein of unknown function [Cupriavidus taiwanensis]SOZ12482.1 protein of unknown function [Cupriavidus taiwanensis]SOZ43788.1 protein of unknown function [Cupriavidus taiwanensis]SPC23029.1 protein of unknown function [Cupriavidus taiwanensis]SPD54538.1 protein of unknown function [Cupriavidus taiwanensis]